MGTVETPSSFGAPPPPPPSSVGLPWYRTTWFTVLSLIVFFPLGLALMWTRRPGWGKGVNWFATGLVTAAVVALGVTAPQHPAVADRPSVLTANTSVSTSAPATSAPTASALPSAVAATAVPTAVPIVAATPPPSPTATPTPAPTATPAPVDTPQATAQAPTPAAAPAPPTSPPPPPPAAPPPPAPAPPPPVVTSGFDVAAATAAGASAICHDGTWSFSQNRSGTCSYHGGVHWWTGNLGAAGPGAH